MCDFLYGLLTFGICGLRVIAKVGSVKNKEGGQVMKDTMIDHMLYTVLLSVTYFNSGETSHIIINSEGKSRFEFQTS